MPMHILPDPKDRVHVHGDRIGLLSGLAQPLKERAYLVT